MQSNTALAFRDTLPATEKTWVRGRLPRRRARVVDRRVGERIRVLRLLRGLSMQQLAEASGVSFQQIQKYETAANQVCASRLWALSKALNCPIAYFFENADNIAASSNASDAAFADSVCGAFEDDGIPNLREGLRFAHLCATIDRTDVRQQILGLATALGAG